MTENSLHALGYYDTYIGLTLRNAAEIVNDFSLPEATLKYLREKESLRILVLGSATPTNLYYASRIDHFFRSAKKVEGDAIIVIDQNMYPLTRHKPIIDSIEGRDDWPGIRKSTPEFPLAHFELTRADMRTLPLPAESIDMVITDFTFNYLDTLQDVNAAFGQISRVLTDNGLMIFSARGNKQYPFDGIVQDINGQDMESMYRGGFQIHCFPTQTYALAAQDQNLMLTDYCTIHHDLYGYFCKNGSQPKVASKK